MEDEQVRRSIMVADDSAEVGLMSALYAKFLDVNPHMARYFPQPRINTGNKYRPHQGERECARRRSQIAKGMIKAAG